MEKSNPSSSPEIKFSISERLKKAEEAIDQQKSEKPQHEQGIDNKKDSSPSAETADKKDHEAIDTKETINRPKDALPSESNLNIESTPDNKTNIELQENKENLDATTVDEVKIDMGNADDKFHRDLDKRYNVKGNVGKGGMGVIRSVEDTNLKRTLAMKILSPKYFHDEGVTKAFVEEACITAQLQHPNIIPVHDIGTLPETGNHFYTMKLVEGLSLQDVIDQLKQRDPEFQKEYNLFNLMSIFKKVCDALAYAHSKGIIHRDIKPGNIMVGQFGEVLLLDWGLAKHSNTDDSADMERQMRKSQTGCNSLMTMDGIIKGSLAYLSPEQANGDIKEVDHLTDIFLLGATLYHMLTLEPPYRSKNMVEIIRMAETTAFTHPNETEFGKRIPETLVNMILKSMAGDKADRFQSVTELSQKIDDYLQGRNVSDLRTYNAGDVLIHDQDLGDDCFIVVSGRVEISRNIDGTETVIETLEKGAVFGELAALTHDLRTATAKSIEDNTQVMVVSKQLMFDEIRKLPPWLEKIVFNLASKVSSMNERIHPFVLSNCSLPVLKQLLYLYSMVNTNADNEQTVSISYEGVIHEISQNLGLSSSRIEEVLSVLEEFRLAEKSSNGRFCINSMGNLKNLIAYIKREQNITEGIGYTLAEIDIEKIPLLDDVYQRMATLHY